MDDDDFGVFDKKGGSDNMEHHLGGQNRDDEATKSLKKELNDVFGLFPPQNNFEAKYIMISFELSRIHQRQ